MHKIVILSVALLSLFGCASKGSVTALSERVDALEAQDKVTQSEHEQLVSNQASLRSSIDELTNRVDRAFVKR